MYPEKHYIKYMYYYYHFIFKRQNVDIAFLKKSPLTDSTFETALGLGSHSTFNSVE